MEPSASITDDLEPSDERKQQLKKWIEERAGVPPPSSCVSEPASQFGGCLVSMLLFDY
jgi:hypothetical protein